MMIERAASFRKKNQKSGKSLSVFVKSGKAQGSFRQSELERSEPLPRGALPSCVISSHLISSHFPISGLNDHNTKTHDMMDEFEEAERAESMKRGRSSRQLSMLAKDEEPEGLSDEVVKTHQIQTLKKKLEEERKQKEEVKKLAQDLGRRLSTHEPLQLDRNMKEVLELQGTLAVPMIAEDEGEEEEEEEKEGEGGKGTA